MRNGTSTAPQCSGIVIHNSEDGPEVAACIDPCCTAPAGEKFRRRSDVRSNGFTAAMLADMASDEAW
jgi:hypothetical protein